MTHVHGALSHGQHAVNEIEKKEKKNVSNITHVKFQRLKFPSQLVNISEKFKKPTPWDFERNFQTSIPVLI